VGIFAGRSTPISLGNVTFKPSGSGADWYNSIRLLRASDAEEYPTLTFDGPVEAWHKNETYNDSGKTRAKAMIFAAHWSSWATQGGRVKGLNLLTVHNTSTSAQKIDADIRVMGENRGSCNKIENDAGQITAEMKASVYYIDDSNTSFKICE
jgi:hypothetical protein